MHKDISKSLNKRILSLLAASAVTFSQIITVMPMQATAAESDTENGISDSPEIICVDANGDSIIDAKDFSIIEKYARTGDESGINLIAADVDISGKVDLRDAEIVMQHYALLCTGATGFVFPFEGELEWKTYPDPSNYQIVNKGMTLEEAEIYCEENGGHLAVIPIRNR